MIVHMNHPSEYSSHARFEETLLDHLIHSPIAIAIPSYLRCFNSHNSLRLVLFLPMFLSFWWLQMFNCLILLLLTGISLPSFGRS